MLDHVIFMPNTESRIPMRMNVQLTEVYEVDPTTGKVAPFPSALEIRGADAELFQQMLLKDEGKKEFARLLRDPSRVYTHDQFILLMKETRMALFQDAISIQMRLNNLCTILDLMIKCHQEVIDSNKYPTVDEQRWAVEELSNRIHDLRTLTANLAIRHKASTPHFEIFYQHILAPAMEMRFERLDKQLGVSTQLTTPIHPSSAVTSRTATVLAPSSASQDQDAKSSSSGSASSSPTPSA
jgi:hypothetical protein